MRRRSHGKRQSKCREERNQFGVERSTNHGGWHRKKVCLGVSYGLGKFAWPWLKQKGVVVEEGEQW